MINRGKNFQQVPLNIVGSSIFGRYPKISVEKTYNMFQSDTFMVPYAGYEIAVQSKEFNNGFTGRGIFYSTKFGKLVVVVDATVYLVSLIYDQSNEDIIDTIVTPIGTLVTRSGAVFITENNKPQLCISDGQQLYIYDPTQTPPFQNPTIDGTAPINFVPGYVTFHDTYFICAASNDTSGVLPSNNRPANNTWRLSNTGDGLLWPDDASHVGTLETKPDNTRATVRFPSKGNMIFIMGSNVTEAWFDTGSQLFPYQRSNQFNIDYGCLAPTTVAYMDEMVVWLAGNEKSGPVIMFSNGGMPEKISTDGIDYLMSTFQNPQDAQGFIYRQDGHLFYHINFYSDNVSLFYDFTTKKFYHASDQNLNFFIASQVAFYKNQYYFISKTSGNLFSFDTIFTTYQDVDENENMVTYEIPRIRICQNIRLPTQDYFILNDVGFTIESGETNYQQQSIGPITLITQDGNVLVTQPEPPNLITQDGQYIVSQSSYDEYFVTQTALPFSEERLIAQTDAYLYLTPRVDLSISYDGGAAFGTYMPYELPPIGKRRNRLLWWNLGIANDAVCKFRFTSIGRAVITDGVVNIRY